MPNLTNRVRQSTIDALDDDCHDYHNDPLDGYRTCRQCALWAEERADQVVFQFHFTVADIKKAEEWAESNKFRYENIEHLLHDALIEKVIQTNKWKAA